jgi:hypothetical protein
MPGKWLKPVYDVRFFPGARLPHCALTGGVYDAPQEYAHENL